MPAFSRTFKETGTNKLCFGTRRVQKNWQAITSSIRRNAMKKTITTLLAGIVAGVLFLGSSAVSQTGDSMNKKLTIVFVHGLWADGSCWSKVIDPLVDKGYKVISVQNPTTSLEDDVAATKRALDRADGDVVLVGHSWGGSVITEAGADPRVKALVYIAAFAPDKGETAGSLGDSVAPTILPGFIQNANGYLTLSREGVAKGFAADLSPKEQELVYAVQPPASQKVFGDVGVNAAWKTKPSWFVVASEDNAINPELEKRMAKRANAKTTILKSSHVAMLSKPNEVLDVILDAAKSVSK
jgi:pimeloyl-ACP methyl ester carboxylesterase